ncbi:MAG: hypothetical protein AAF316_16025 [Cyanobacteria bacterium P01_A01_bin.80]
MAKENTTTSDTSAATNSQSIAEHNGLQRKGHTEAASKIPEKSAQRLAVTRRKNSTPKLNSGTR